MTAIHPLSPVETLQRRILGAAIEPGTPGWEEATQAFNTRFTQTPALVTIPAGVQDVVAIVEFARANGLQVAAQRTGHNAEPFGPAMDEIVLVKTDLLQGVEIDAERATARVASGVKWAQVVPRASELGLAALHGSTPDVSVTGYSLGGGVGWYARKLGLWHEQRPRDRARHRRRQAPARRPRARCGAVLGAARRRGELRGRDGDRDPALRDPRDLRRRALLPVGAVGRGAARVERMADDGAGRG